MKEFIDEKAAHVDDLMKERLNIRGRDLAAKLRHTGRMLPKRIKREVAFLAETEKLAENPKLHPMINRDRVEKAYHACVEYLDSVDDGERRKDLLLGILGNIAMGFLVVSALVVTVLVWRGYI